MTRVYARKTDSLRQKILDLLHMHGPLLLNDLVDELTQHTRGGISASLVRLHQEGEIYVHDWEMTSPGEKKHPRPMWQHASHSKRQPPHDKVRPLPEGNHVRLKKRRIARRDNAPQVRCLYKLIKTPPKTRG